jgi:hypothetical protein
MKGMIVKGKTVGAAFAVLALLVSGGHHPTVAAKKMKPEDLVALHLQSIGSADGIKARTSCTATGKARMVVYVGTERLLEGEATFLSEGRKYKSALVFPVSDYPGEELSFDGKKTYVSQLSAGKRSKIGEFLYRYEVLLKEGLIGGALSTAWPLLDIKNRKPKLKYNGLKKLAELELHELQYRFRRGGSDFRVNLYFEPETYHHIATIYKLEIPDAPTMAPGPGTTGAERAANSSTRIASRYTIEERFGDFREVDGLKVPSFWKLRYVAEEQGSQIGGFSAANRDLSMLEWQVNFDKVEHNTPMDAKVFVLY